MNMYANERKCGLYIDLLMTVRYSHEAWGWVVSVSVHGEQTQSHLRSGGGVRACGEPSMS